MNKDIFNDYAARLGAVLGATDWTLVETLASWLATLWKDGGHLFLCGNGGSAANAMHLANDFLCGIDGKAGTALRVQALSANAAVLTCLANDTGYDNIFSLQLKTLARPGDVLIVLSGSGNSPNIVEALLAAKEKGVKSAAILGFTGGRCKDLADLAIHFPVDDMQIAEDLQLIAGHMIMKRLSIRIGIA